MRIEYRFEGPPGANGVAPYVSEGRAINAAKITFRNRWRGPGDLLKVFRKTTDGEVFIGHVEYDPRERVVLWYPSGQETKRTAAMSDGTLNRIRLVYAQAERRQRPEYSPLPKWETLSIEVREAIIHVYRQGRVDALRERSRSEGPSMSTIDKQRIAAVRKLEQLGYTFAAGDWMHPTNNAAPLITDALHALLMKRAVEKENEDDPQAVGELLKRRTQKLN